MKCRGGNSGSGFYPSELVGGYFLLNSPCHTLYHALHTLVRREIHGRLKLYGQLCISFFKTQPFLVKSPTESIDDHGYYDGLMLFNEVGRTLTHGGIGLGSALREAHYPAVVQPHFDFVLGVGI